MTQTARPARPDTEVVFDPATYVDGVPFGALARLRAAAPVACDGPRWSSCDTGPVLPQPAAICVSRSLQVNAQHEDRGRPVPRSSRRAWRPAGDQYP